MRKAWRSPVTCLVSDRRRLPAPCEENLIRLTGAAAAAGVDLIQIRERDLDDRVLLELARRVLAVTAGTATAVLLNDRTDLALAAGAHGVHLRADSVSAERVRGMAPEGFLVGRSVHAAGEAAVAERTGVDYLLMGTIFPTRSKADSAPLAGLEELSHACRAVRVPVLAIGGITADTLADVAAAGASGVAAIGLFCSTVAAQADGDLEDSLRRLLATIRSAFEFRSPPSVDG